jgi:hypothetical protein
MAGIRKSCIGRVKSWEDKANDFKAWEIDCGGQYPIRCGTSDSAPNAQMKAAMDWPLAVVSFDESEGKMNPSSGKPYINRYLVGVEQAPAGAVAGLPDAPAASGGAASNGEAKTGGTFWKPRDPAETRSIVRQVAVKSAFEFYSMSEDKEQGILDAFALAEAMEDWVHRPEPVTAPDEPQLVVRARESYRNAADFPSLRKAFTAVGDWRDHFACEADYETAIQGISEHSGRFSPNDWAQIDVQLAHYAANSTPTPETAASDETPF